MKFGRFEFDPQTDRLGEGPQSEVFRAVDTQLRRTVALKILRPHVDLDPAAARRFEREAAHTSSLAHDNIATVYDFKKPNGSEPAYIVMEYLEGRTLDKRIKDGPLSVDETVQVGLRVCEALAHVHQRGLVHRDLKPANIMVLEDGRVKLLDFGICRSSQESNITQSGMLVGTVLYMSPEQVRGDPPDPCTDVFALGSVLYHALTGALPFPGRSFPEVCMAILDGQPIPAAEHRKGIPEPLQEFLQRCHARDREQRFADGEAAHGALLAASERMRGRRVHKRSRLRGHMLIPPIRVSGGAEGVRLLAGGLRRDLCSELSRSTQLDVLSIEDGPGAEGGNGNGNGVANGSFVMRAELAVVDQTGILDYTLERANGAKLTETTEIWRERLECTDADEWGLQAQLVGSLARSVKRRLEDHSRQPVAEDKRDPDRARALCRHAHVVLHRGTTKHLLAAVSSFRRALEADATCSLAYAGMAEAMVFKFLYWDGDATFIDEAQEFTRQAAALCPDCAEAHTSLGFIAAMTGRPAEADREYRLAIQLDRDEWLAHRLLGALLARQGNYKDAAKWLRRAKDLNPTHIGSYDHLYAVLTRLDRHDEALEVGEEAIERAHKHLRDHPDDQEARLHLALLRARMGARDEALRLVAKARELSPKDGYTAFHGACVYCVLGDVEHGLAALKEAEARGYYIQSELSSNTDLDCLRGSEGFQELSA